MNALESDPRFEALLEYLRDGRGFDFTGYKRGSVARRIGKRMAQVGIREPDAYQDHLEANPSEFVDLFNTILINVTRFFRDPEAWRFLTDTILPRILSSKGQDDEIRLWSAGCASGEEAYSLAMILAEALDPRAFKERVKIYATDVDEEALSEGRRGIYSTTDVEDVPLEMRDRWFKPTDDHMVLSPDIRRSVIFGRQDLVHDSPISRIDLLVCRNVLMYFTSETQAGIIARLHFALKDEGFLFLGRSEMLFSGRDYFTPVEMRHRVFAKVADEERRRGRPSYDVVETDQTKRDRLVGAAVDATKAAQIVVDEDGRVIMVNQRARQQFGLHKQDVGRPLQDLEISYRPMELRSRIDLVHAERRPIEVLAIERALPDGATQFLDLSVAPVQDNVGGVLGTIVTFTDVTDAVKLRSDVERAQQELETAYEELQATNEEVETTNEELQSTVEELETTNEELQSSNEELETMNEELQSTNEQLQTVNDELRERTDDLNRTTDFTESILASISAAVFVVDETLTIRVWSAPAQDLWGMRSGEVVGTKLSKLDCGLPVADVIDPIQEAMIRTTPTDPVEVDALDRRGRSIRCRIRCMPVRVPDGMRGVVVLTEVLA